MTSKYCDKCFVDLENEVHKEWCPYHNDLPEFLKDIFKTDENTKKN